MDKNILIRRLDDLLPQTQCRECGFSGCLPYAEAMADRQADINLCAPGGVAVMRDLAHALGKSETAPAKEYHAAVAVIDEAACIGCVACIRACPVDAIVGAAKQMHTVIRGECTGCGLCVAPCPVDCITMQPVQADYLPLNRDYSGGESVPRFAAAAHAKYRYRARLQRLARLRAARKLRLEHEKIQTALSENRNATQAAPLAAGVNPSDLIAQAMKRAAALQDRQQNPVNQAAFKEQQLEEARRRAAYRRALRDVRYGNEEARAQAIEWLRQYKAEQEADDAV